MGSFAKNMLRWFHAEEGVMAVHYALMAFLVVLAFLTAIVLVGQKRASDIPRPELPPGATVRQAQ